MRNIILLAWADIRKNKGASLTIAVLVLVASLLLNLGLLTFFNFGSFFDQKAEQLHSAHAALGCTNEYYQSEYETYFKNYPGVEETQKSQALILSAANFIYGKGTFTNTIIVSEAVKNQKLSPFTLVGESLPAGQNSIYVPELLRTGGGYRLGGEFILNYKEEKYTFKIAGFFEDIMLGSINAGGVGVFLTPEAFNHLSSELGPSVKGVLFSVRMNDPADAEKMVVDFKKDNNLEAAGDVFSTAVWVQDISLIKMARTLTANIGSVIIVAFAAIIVLIGLVVIRFRINNSIQDSMADIGTLKSMGYTSRQIVGSLLFRFVLLAFLGSFTGIALSYFILPVVSLLFAAQAGLTWTQGFDFPVSACALGMILLAVAAVSLICARRIKSLHPIIALRGGITTHSFRYNPFPLDRAKGNLQLLLSLKMMMKNMRQNISVAVIVAAITFGGVFAVVMYYNICVDNKAFNNMVSGEISSVIVYPEPDTDYTNLLKNIQGMDGVRKAIRYDLAFANSDWGNIVVDISEDFSQTENEMLYDGRTPMHENEIAIGSKLSEKSGKNIGDTILIGVGGAKQEYLVTGLIQSSNYVGMEVELTHKGMLRMLPDYKWKSIYIYLEKGKSSSNFIQTLKNEYGNSIASTVDSQEMMHSQLDVYVTIVSYVVVMIAVVTAFIILLILYLLVKTMILQERKEFGIRKAIGFTTFQLMNQVSFSFLPAAALGGLTGGLVGMMGVNPLLSILFRDIGIMRVSFTVPGSWIALLAVGICLLAYGTAMLVSGSIRRITPYSLLSE